jgi:hypothetical protein
MGNFGGVPAGHKNVNSHINKMNQIGVAQFYGNKKCL